MSDKVRSNVPTKPGIYWYRMNGSRNWRHQEVYRYTAPMGWHPTLKGKLCVNSGSGPVPIERMHRHWRAGTKRPR